LSGGNEVRFQNKGLEPIDLESGKWSLNWEIEGIFLLLNPLLLFDPLPDP
jgi:hypothetical protein